MKMRLLTALVAAGCFSQMAVADMGELTTGSITNQTTATATVTIKQPVTLENTLTPELKAAEDKLQIAKGNLKIMETGVKAKLAIKSSPDDAYVSFTAYAAGHDGDGDYKLEYVAIPEDLDSFSQYSTSDGFYLVSNNEVSGFNYIVYNRDDSLPKAGNYVISVTGAVYNP